MNTHTESNMFHDPDMLSAHKYLLQLTTTMVELANRGEWPALIDEEIHYLLAIEELQQQSDPGTLNREQQQQRSDMVETILEHSLTIQRLLVARRDSLGQLIEQTRCKQNMDRAYLSQGYGEPGDLLC